MKLSYLFLVSRLPLLLSCSVNCTTFGVQAEDHVLTTDSNAQGIERFEVEDMPTHEGMSIRGGGERFVGEMRVTGWFAPEDDHDIFDYLSLSFDHVGDSLRPVTRFHSVEAEHITVREVFFEVPRELDVDVQALDGSVAVSDIAGSVAVHTSFRPVVVTEVDGPVTIRGASSVYVDDTGRVAIDAVGEVTGAIGHGGSVDASFNDIDIRVSGDDFERLSLTTSLGEIEVELPSGGWTLDIDAGYSKEFGDEEEPGHVLVDVGDVYIDEPGVVSDVYQVNGGGPVIVIRDAHEVEIRVW